MNYELAKELKDAGFPQIGESYKAWNKDTDPIEYCIQCQDWAGELFVYKATLEELIEACGKEFQGLAQVVPDKWHAKSELSLDVAEGTTPTEAVAKLWLSLRADKSIDI